MQHITVPLPDRLSAAAARRLAADIEHAVTKRTGALVEATITDLGPLSDQERAVICAALEVAADATNLFGFAGPGMAEAIRDLRAEVDPGNRSAIVSETLRDTAGQFEELSRQQECAADAMASEYGRSRVRHLADGAVVIVGMTDDVKRRTVCVERDGRERWRS